MFKLPTPLPTVRASSEEWADFAECVAIKRGSVSLLDLIKDPMLISDEVVIEGADDETDDFIALVDDISSEINNRIVIMGSSYPFILINNDYTLKYNANGTSCDIVYKYLLFATRLKMSSNKIQAGIDGTLLFEKLCGEVAKNYFGGNAQVDVFGTSRSEGGFRAKLRDVVQRLGEGGAIHENHGYRPQDDDLDVIVWKGFRDLKPSKLIGFGQCKTGTSWQSDTTELNVSSFCKTWFTQQIVLDPVKMFFTAQYFPREIWYARAYQAGLVFDRYRIIEYLPDELDDTIFEDIRRWTAAAEII